MSEYKPHITDNKKKEVKDVVQLIKKYQIIGVVNLENLPTLQLQRIKNKLGDKIELKITKRRFMDFAIDQLKDKKNLDQLKEYLKGVPALLLTNENPFKLYQLLQTSSSAAPAKAGQNAPNDLVIPSGPTNFGPGPMIGELGQLGIKTEVKDGKISVRDDFVLVKEGDEISSKAAELLAKFGFEPMKIGLNLVVAYEAGNLYKKDVLSITTDTVLEQVLLAASESMSLALQIGHVTQETVETLIKKASQEARSLARTANIETSEDIVRKLAEAEGTAEKLAEQVPDVPTEEVKEEKKEEPQEEPPAEEKKEEVPHEEPQQEVKEEAKEESLKEEQKPEEPKDGVEKQVEEEQPTKEEPEVKEKPAEKPEEEPKQEEKKEEVKEEPKDEDKEEPTEEVKADTAKEKMDEEVAQAQKVLKQLQDKKMASSEPSKPQQIRKQETDMNKIINDLKDKKSRGEI